MNARTLLQTMREGEHRLVHYVARNGPDPIVETRGWLFRGRSAAPLVVVIAGVHGNEYDGISACIQLIQILRAKSLGPSVLVVPVANLKAYESQQRHTPMDDLDLNRVFPGSSEGSYTERLAHLIFDSIIGNADLVLSLHGWLHTGSVIDYVEIPAPTSSVYGHCLAIAQNAGFRCIRNTGWLEGRLGAEAATRQIPILESEVGGCGILDQDKASDYLGYVLRAIAAVAAGAEPALQTEPDAATQYFRTTTVVRCAADGFWLRSVDEGQQVEAGAILGAVIQLEDLKATAVLAPSDGIVGAIRKKAQVSEGDELAWMFCS